MFTIFTDGACSGNPGPGFAMWVITENKKVIKKDRVKLKFCTNNEAEYKALSYALKDLIKNKNLIANEAQILFKLDSKLVVEQVNGRWKIKDAKIRTYVFEVNTLLNELKIPAIITHIPREQNLADELKY